MIYTPTTINFFLNNRRRIYTSKKCLLVTKGKISATTVETEIEIHKNFSVFSSGMKK